MTTFPAIIPLTNIPLSQVAARLIVGASATVAGGTSAVHGRRARCGWWPTWQEGGGSVRRNRHSLCKFTQVGFPACVRAIATHDVGVHVSG